jgi:AraC-like DNA-binding protein
VLPDACADIVWTGAELIVAGPATRAVVPSVVARDVKVGVRFRVGAAPLGLGLPAGELRDRSLPLRELWGREGAELTERVATAGSPRERLRLMGGAVARRLAAAQAPDPVVREAVVALARPRGRVDSVARGLAISERQLRRRFEVAVGYSPRTLARVLRLQRFLTLAQAGAGDLAWLAADAGYADQSHLTRDCAELGGLPAGALLAAGAGPAGERLLGPLQLVPAAAPATAAPNHRRAGRQRQHHQVERLERTAAAVG